MVSGFFCFHSKIEAPAKWTVETTTWIIACSVFMTHLLQRLWWKWHTSKFKTLGPKIPFFFLEDIVWYEKLNERSVSNIWINCNHLIKKLVNWRFVLRNTKGTSSPNLHYLWVTIPTSGFQRSKKRFILHQTAYLSGINSTGIQMGEQIIEVGKACQSCIFQSSSSSSTKKSYS